MSVTLADFGACLLAFVAPYGMFAKFDGRFDLRSDTSRANRIEKLSYRLLKPILLVSGVIGAVAAWLSLHDGRAPLIAVLIGTSVAVWLLSSPAGLLAYRQAHGVDQKGKRQR